MSSSLPSWLSRVASPGDQAQSERPSLPEWLRPTAEQGQAVQPARPALPGWLRRVAEPGKRSTPPAEPAPEPPTDQEPPSRAPAEKDEGVPDWLADVSTDEAPPPPSQPPVQEDEDIPEWLAEAAGDDISSMEGGDLPDWLDTSLDEEGDLPDWFEDAPSDSQPDVDPEFVPDDTPDWLTDLSLDEPPPPEPEQEETPPPVEEPPQEEPPPPPPEEKPASAGGAIIFADDLSEDDDIDWFDTSLDMEVKPTSEETPSDGDLLGLSGDFFVEEETDQEGEAEEEEEFLSLRDIDIGGLADSSGDDVDAGELAGLRFSAIMDEAETADDSADIEALKDLSGAIQSRTAFSDVTYNTGDFVEGPVITDSQAEHIAKIEALLKHDSEDVGEADRTDESPVIRLIVGGLLLVGILLPVLTNIGIVPLPGDVPAVSIINDRIAELDADSRVVLAVEYEANAAGELEPALITMLEAIAEADESITLVAVSTRPLGPVMADRIIQAAGPQENWFNIGYVPGDAIGVRAITIGSTGGVPSPLATTVDSTPTELGATSLIELDPDLIIVASARTDELRNWLEQAAPVLGSDIIGVTSSGAAPLLNTYDASDQTIALLGGVTDIASYTDDTSLATTLINAQGITALVVTLIILGAIAYQFTTRRGHT